MSMTKPAIHHDQRAATRVPLGRDGTARDPRQQPIDIIIEDLSRVGCKLNSPLPLPIDRVLNIGIPGVGRREGRVIWEALPAHGVEFLWPLSDEEVACSRTAESLVLGAFPQRLDAMLQPDVPPDVPGRLPRALGIAVIAGGSVALWIACGWAWLALAG
ncbi:PilZ domain-containing protein [Sphingomonas profundi]|uniref:PilZ domain-containing protein n=1 Tax=Alterirhizorhabdus profundi TaxID=2681549 RepID=UPI0012E75E55|nr:PilZ domain-containing protein [Sphingomonas profundi]